MELMNKLNFVKQYVFRLKRFSVAAKSQEAMASVIPCSETSYKQASKYLHDGQVIAIPTDTIYGLACSANCPEAIKKLYCIKGRDSAKPVAICVSYVSDLRKWGHAEHLSDELLNKLLPGPVTIVLDRTNNLDNPFLNPSTCKIGIRIPDHKFVNEVTKMFDMPVALTSANYSNEPSTLSVKEFEQLYIYLGAVFDGGILSKGLEQNRTGSTVIDLSSRGLYKIIRRGISYDKIVKVVEHYGLVSI